MALPAVTTGSPPRQTVSHWMRTSTSKTFLLIITVIIAILLQSLYSHSINYQSQKQRQQQKDQQQSQKQQNNQNKLNDQNQQSNQNLRNDQKQQDDQNRQNERKHQQNKEPCLPTTRNNAFNIFKKRHVLRTDISGTDPDQWTEYLKTNGLLGRTPVQSFFEKIAEAAVSAICNGKGHVYKDNLCISDEKFDVFNVMSKKDQNGKFVLTVEKKTQRVVVACDTIDGECVPVHFEMYNNQQPQNTIC